QRHSVEHYWDVVARLGIFPQRPEDHIPTWHVGETERAAAHATLTKLGVQWDRGSPLVLLHPGAHGFGGSKRWPVASFVELAKRLLDQQVAQVVVLGGQEDVEAAATIVAATDGRALSLAGQTNLRESVAVIANAGVYIGCDSGLTQIAVALGVPTVALFGVSNLAQFEPRTNWPERLRILLPDPLPEPIGFFVGTESAFARHDYAHDTRMATIGVEKVYEATLALCHCDASAPISPPVAG
ncbi:MAG TPA: glycosyltransferase family 9 protein, partial [Ktedonobacterales bacterium]|nr:glycosyltransferase family 9 protein [Ktedonobacterales bacterium]